ncbi:MAG: hypothetical protein ACOYMS_01795 [Terrimicrobiaceae bacterium]
MEIHYEIIPLHRLGASGRRDLADDLGGVRGHGLRLLQHGQVRVRAMRMLRLLDLLGLQVTGHHTGRPPVNRRRALPFFPGNGNFGTKYWRFRHFFAS